MEWKLSLTRAEYWLIGLLVLAQLAFWVRHAVVLKRLQARSKNLWPKALIRIGYVTLLFVSILGPVLGTVEESLTSNSRNIWFLLDVSESMNATDVLPSRLERAKKMISNVVDKEKSDRVGLIIFADTAYMQCPLTYDKEAFLLFLQSINTNQVLNQGTQINEAFQVLLMKTDSVSKYKPMESNVALLFTDGEDFGSDAEASINRLTEVGFRVSCVGVGNPNGGAIPIRGGNRFLQDEKGEKIISKLNEAALEALALEGKGQYFSISGKTDNPEDLVRWINTQKALSVVAQKHSIAADKYHYPLTIALFLIVLDVVFTFSTVKFN